MKPHHSTYIVGPIVTIYGVAMVLLLVALGSFLLDKSQTRMWTPSSSGSVATPLPSIPVVAAPPVYAAAQPVAKAPAQIEYVAARLGVPKLRTDVPKPLNTSLRLSDENNGDFSLHSVGPDRVFGPRPDFSN